MWLQQWMWMWMMKTPVPIEVLLWIKGDAAVFFGFPRRERQSRTSLQAVVGVAVVVSVKRKVADPLLFLFRWIHYRG